MSELLSRLGIGGKVREHRLVTEWESMVGPRVAARARPDGLERGVLYVRVTNSAWMHELGFLRQALVEAARRVTGDPPIVKEVRFHLGSRHAARDDGDDPVAELAARRKPRPAPRAPAPAVDAAAAAEIDRSTASVGDGELREIIRAAWKRLPPRGR